MRDEPQKSILNEELGPKQWLIVGAIAAAVVVAGAIFVLLDLRGGSFTRRPRRAEIPAASAHDPAARAVPAQHDDADERLGPLATPDGGWPTEPRSLDHMDEIPAGVLHQGSIGPNVVEDETPATDLRLDTFYIDRYEVTNEQYQRCVDAGVCRSARRLDEERYGAPRQPVVGVTWHDARTFCRWSGKRLPTEAEWERAARGDDRRVFPWGDAPPSCDRAIYSACDRYGPAEVGGRPEGAGPFGTQDLAGNVWEWVEDWYAPRHFPPAPGETPAGPPAGQQRVLRGGSWQLGPDYARTGNRHRADPATRAPWYGFRCAWSPPPPPAPVPAAPAQLTPGDAGVGAASLLAPDAATAPPASANDGSSPRPRDAGPPTSATTAAPDAVSE